MFLNISGHSGAPGGGTQTPKENVPRICNPENIAPQKVLQQTNSAPLQKIMKKGSGANLFCCKPFRNNVVDFKHSDLQF